MIARSSLGDANVRVGRTTDAIEAFEKSIEINPNNENAVEKLRDLRAKG